MLVWPPLLPFIVWIERATLGCVIEALTIARVGVAVTRLPATDGRWVESYPAGLGQGGGESSA
jgi:hypothetical protein